MDFPSTPSEEDDVFATDTHRSDGHDPEDWSARSITEVFPWTTDVDYIVEAGLRGRGLDASELSTVVDLTSGEPLVLRQGKGTLSQSLL